MQLSFVFSALLVGTASATTITKARTLRGGRKLWGGISLPHLGNPVAAPGEACESGVFGAGIDCGHDNWCTNGFCSSGQKGQQCADGTFNAQCQTGLNCDSGTCVPDAATSTCDFTAPDGLCCSYDSGCTCPAGKSLIQVKSYEIGVNGCGPVSSAALTTVLNDVSDQGTQKCCRNHDRCYNGKGNKSWKACNQDQEDCMKNTCSEVWGVKNPLCLAQSAAFFEAVSSSGGKEAWKASKLDDGYLSCQ